MICNGHLKRCVTRFYYSYKKFFNTAGDERVKHGEVLLKTIRRLKSWGRVGWGGGGGGNK